MELIKYVKRKEPIGTFRSHPNSEGIYLDEQGQVVFDLGPHWELYGAEDMCSYCSACMTAEPSIDPTLIWKVIITVEDFNALLEEIDSPSTLSAILKEHQICVEKGHLLYEMVLPSSVTKKRKEKVPVNV